MIWLFKSDKTKVNEHYLFDVNDIGFDITLYDISLYMHTPTYFLLSDTNPEEIYYLDYSVVVNSSNPSRLLVSKDTYYYNVVSNYYRQQYRDNQLNNIGIC